MGVVGSMRMGDGYVWYARDGEQKNKNKNGATTTCTSRRCSGSHAECFVRSSAAGWHQRSHGGAVSGIFTWHARGETTRGVTWPLLLPLPCGHACGLQQRFEGAHATRQVDVEQLDELLVEQPELGARVPAVPAPHIEACYSGWPVVPAAQGRDGSGRGGGRPGVEQTHSSRMDVRLQPCSLRMQPIMVPVRWRPRLHMTISG